MLTTKPTVEMTQKWKKVFEDNHDKLFPNRKTGKEVDEYFKKNYEYEELDSPKHKEIVEYNITHSNHNKAKLPDDMMPEIAIYKIKNTDILVGIDRVTGFFQIESKNTEKMAEIYDDLFAFRGLDLMDIDNYFLVAQYIECTNK